MTASKRRSATHGNDMWAAVKGSVKGGRMLKHPLAPPEIDWGLVAFATVLVLSVAILASGR